jgi:aminoglycoside phosphotransferase (APT) family kinase protein
VLSLEPAGGGRELVVLRRYFERESLTPERAVREFRILQLVNKVGIPSARPLLLDTGGEFFAAPALLLSYLPGRPLYEPRDKGAWVEQVARVMLTIHAVTPRTDDLSWLPRFSRDAIATELDELRAQALAAGSLGRQVHAALVKNLDAVAWPEPCLIHEDFWPGNTVWFRQRLVGVIDWINAKLGDPRCDVTQCAIDAMLVMGFETSERLRDAYQRLAPAPLPDLWYFELFNGLRSLIYYEHWLKGYDDAGLEVTAATALERIEAMLRRALSQAG